MRISRWLAALLVMFASCTPTNRDIQTQAELDQQTIPPLQEAILDFEEAHGRWPTSLNEIAGFASARHQPLDVRRIKYIKLEPTEMAMNDGPRPGPDSALNLTFEFKSAAGLPGILGTMYMVPRRFTPARLLHPTTGVSRPAPDTRPS